MPENPYFFPYTPILAPTTVLVGATVPYFGGLSLKFEKAETCRVDLKIQVKPNGKDSTLISEAEIKNFGVVGINSLFRMDFYALDLRDMN